MRIFIGRYLRIFILFLDSYLHGFFNLFSSALILTFKLSSFSCQTSANGCTTVHIFVL